MLDFSVIDSSYKFKCTISDNGVVLTEKIICISLEPHKSMVVEIPGTENVYGEHVMLDIDILHNGESVGFEQFELSRKLSSVKSGSFAGGISEDDEAYILAFKNLEIGISKKTGMIESLKNCSAEMLDEPMQLNAFRAPLDNDCNIRDNWYKIFADKLKPKIYSVGREDNEIICRLAKGYSSYEPMYRAAVVYSLCENGVKISVKADINKKLRYLPRFGIRLFIKKDMDRITYLGYGPRESYIDKRNSSRFGMYTSGVDSEYVDYIRPQEGGSHYGCDQLTVNGEAGNFTVTSDAPFSFSYLGYTQEEFTTKKHNFELERAKSNVLCVDYGMTGVGPRPAVVICPGGGYECVCQYWEGERYAMAYASAGFNTIVVNYTTVGGGVYPRQIREIARAFEITRQHAEEWEIDPNKIAVCGSSAGGHLAASISTLWNCEDIFTKEEIESRIMRPDATVLSYPVITSGEKAHKGSFKALTGIEDENDPLWNFLSLENRVNEGTPPAFLWHCFDDTDVPVENSFYYARSLRNYNIPFELHVYPEGGHGIQLTTQRILRSKSMFRRDFNWHSMSVDWLIDVLKV